MEILKLSLMGGSGRKTAETLLSLQTAQKVPAVLNPEMD